jgi:hypothetical protein
MGVSSFVDAPSKGAEPFLGFVSVGSERRAPALLGARRGKIHHAKTGKASDAASSGDR